MTAVEQTAELPAVGSGLAVADLMVAFGGNVAVSGATFAAPVGRITGLIGPNGAGKTTIFNACNGLLRPSAGSVHLFGRDVTRRSPAARAQLGLGRTFQRVEVCNAMTVRANVALGREARVVGVSPFRQVFSRAAERRSVADATDAALEVCGITDIASAPAATLSTGQRRLVELARVLAGGFTMLLLDEPSSGLDDEETDRFGEILERVLAEREVGILLVEHDMGLVMSVCSYLYVLDFGQLIFDGTPAETQASNEVRAAYLGSEEVGA